MGGPICKMCNDGNIENIKVYRMSKAGVAIGYILLVLSAILLLVAVVIIFNMPNRGRDLGFLQALETGLAQVSAIFFGICGLGSAFFGWLLVMKKKVLKCNQCGVEVPASLRGFYDGAP